MVGRPKKYKTEEERLKARKESTKRWRQRQAEVYHALRFQILDMLGGKCKCGEQRYVCLDLHHTEGIGENRWSRKKKWEKSRIFYKWMKEGIPDDIQLLCANCHRVEHST